MLNQKKTAPSRKDWIMRKIRTKFSGQTKYGEEQRLRQFREEYQDTIGQILESIKKHKGLGEYEIKLAARKFKRAVLDSGKIINRHDMAAFKKFVREHYGKESLLGDERDETGLTEEQIKQNLKRAKRINRALDVSPSDESGQPSYLQRKFAAQSDKTKGEIKRDEVIKRMNSGGLASAKDMKFLGEKPSTSALASEKSGKVGFVKGAEKKETGFANQINKPSSLTKTGGKVAPGIGSNPGGAGPMKL